MIDTLLRRAPLALLVSAALACGSTPPPPATGSATATGAIAGVTFAPADAASGTGGAQFTGNNGCEGAQGIASIVIRGTTGLCSDLRDGYARANEQLLDIVLSNYSATWCDNTPPLTTGTYPVEADNGDFPPDGLSGSAAFNTSDASCMEVASRSTTATAGSVVLTAASATGFQGTYDLTFASGDHVTGTFDTSDCYGYDPEEPNGSACH